MKKSLPVLLMSAAFAGAPLLHAQDPSGSPAPSPSASPSENSQPGGPGGHHPGRHGFEPFTAHLLMDLALTDAQKAQIKTITEGAKGGGHKPGQMKETLSQIRAILTPAQQQLVDDFIKYAEDRRALNPGHGKNGGQGGAAPEGTPQDGQN